MKILMSHVKRIRFIYIILMVIAGIAFQFASAGVLDYILEHFFRAYVEGYENMVDVLTDKNMQMLFYVCLLAPILEEFVFRGPIFSFAKKHLPFLIANGIQAILFGIYHGNMIQGVYAFIFGLILGYIIKLTGSVFYTMIMHMSINITGVFLENIVPKDSEKYVINIICIISGVIVAGIIAYLISDYKKQLVVNEGKNI